MIRIITDSTSDFTAEQAERLGVDHIVPMKVNFGTEEYLAGVTITNEEFYQKLAQSRELPITTLVTAAEYAQVYDAFPEDDLLVLPLSCALSGSYHSACMAKEASGRDNIYVVDTKAVCLALSLLVHAASLLRAQGKSARDCYGELAALVPKLRMVAAVDTLEYLVKGGRLSRAAGLVAQTLNVKPLIALEDGQIVSCAKARSMKGAIKLVHKLITQQGPADPRYPVYFAHSLNLDYAGQIRRRFGVEDESTTVCIGPIVGAHVGLGAVGVAFFAK